MTPTSGFTDRTDAGRQLAAVLQERGIDPDVVLAIPRGGLPLGRAVADAFDVPLDIVVARNIGAPRNPEYAIGAVASDGSVWRNEEAIESLGVDEAYFERKREEEADNARQKAERYRGHGDEPDHAGMTVDDLQGLDLAYAPPFSPVWDPVATAGKVHAGNLEGPA